jgi:hypothetical protein
MFVQQKKFLDLFPTDDVRNQKRRAAAFTQKTINLITFVHHFVPFLVVKGQLQ